jgi:hypothetical protein
MIQVACLLQYCVRLPFSLLSIDTFDFQHLRADRISAKHLRLEHLGVPRRLARLLPAREVRCFESDCEAIMWKITTRGFKLEEVLIMAAMNLLASADTVKHEKRASQTSKGDRAWKRSTR